MTKIDLNIIKIELFGCPIHQLSMEQTIAIIDHSIENRIFLQHVVVNAAKLANMQKDAQLKESIINCNIINADGQAVVWASKLLGKALPERVAGIDLMENLVKLANQRNYRIFFFGAKEDIVRKVVDKYSDIYSPGIIAGYRNGYYSKEDEPEIAKQIADSKADILFVAITSPKKEIFINAYKDIMNTPFTMGVGGSFDVVAGITKRAPKWMQNSGLEWLYRVIQEPGRMWKRYLITNTQFIGMVIKYKLGLNKKL
ncbi:WecB/TagA/CpsF family glycosyltransferase [Albibacterium sp.]|uniref:WecB/TagA/CpsF family glycosyltransferase n=1 Tax=Albibacterium sp. TaxID=2952885 RepID=UPI002BB59F8C|nr:WecB/TagA/CpsF family glycosyltransferase [Albibacterium sp.]HUH18894.1 WecB/TagA/CpsF family glycosyltransferase [Albibacterium sp.]